MENEITELELESDDTVTETEIVPQVQDELVKQSLQTEIARKKHWREKFQKKSDEAVKAAEDIKQLQEKLSAYEKPLEPKSYSSDEIESRVDLRLSGFSKDEISHMETYAKGHGKKLAEVSNDPFVLSGIEGLRAKAKAAAATPPPSNSSPSIKPNKKLSFEEWKQGR